MANNYWIDEHTLAALDFDNSIDDLTGRQWICSNKSNLRFIDDNPLSDVKKSLRFNGGYYLYNTWGLLTGGALRTIDFWFKITSYTTSTFFSFGSTGYTNGCMAIYFHSDGRLEIDLHNVLIYLSPSVNKWHHIAFSGGNGSTECACFLDGKKQAHSVEPLNTASSYFYIGTGYYGTANNLNIAFFRISNNIRWTQNFTVPELHYYYNKHKLYINDDNTYGIL